MGLFSYATVYFSGEGFKKVEMISLDGNKFDLLKTLLNKCVPGSAITFDIVKFPIKME